MHFVLTHDVKHRLATASHIDSEVLLSIELLWKFQNNGHEAYKDF